MADKTAILAIGTNDESANQSQTHANVANTISKLQREGYAVVVVPPNPGNFGPQHEAVVNAARAGGAVIHHGEYGSSNPGALTNNSAVSIRNTYPGAFIVGDDNAVLINNNQQTPNAVSGWNSNRSYSSINNTDFLPRLDNGSTGQSAGVGNTNSYAPPVTTQGASNSYAAANPAPSTSYSDFTGGLADFNDYLDAKHHIQEELVAGNEDTGRLVVKAEYSYTMRELLCSLLAGKGLKLPNVQMCLSFQLQGLQDALAGVQNVLTEALNKVAGVMDQFMDHTAIGNVLDRINAVIQEAAAIANMINFCGTPIQPKAIPNLMENAMGSFLGAGQNIINQLGEVIPEQMSACASLGADGKPVFDVNLFNSGALKEIGDNLSSILDGSIATNTLNGLTTSLNQVATEFGTLMEKETWVNGTGGGNYTAGGSQFVSGIEAPAMQQNIVYEVETLGTTNFTNAGASANTVGNVFKATGATTGTGTVREVNTGVGVLHNPESTGIAGNAVLAQQIKSAYDQVGGYPVVASDGTIHDNIFDVLLEPEMLQKVRQADNPDPLRQLQKPVYDYCGNVTGFTYETIGGSTERSSGISPTTSTLPGLLGPGGRATSNGLNVEPTRSPGLTPKDTNQGDTVTQTPQNTPRVPNVTETQRNAIEAQNGDIIYNSDQNQAQVYANGAWNNLIGGSGGGGSSYTNADVDLHLNTSTASGGQYLRWNGADYEWESVTASTGDIEAVLSGNGLIGGGTSGAVTLQVDTGTSANKIVQLDSSARLPAVDGSQLTNMYGDSQVNTLLNGNITGDVEPNTDGTQDLGSSTKRWRDLYITGTTIDMDGTQISVVGGNLRVGGVNVTTASTVNSSVDTHLNTSTAANNQVLSWNGSDYAWVANSGGGISSTDDVPEGSSNLYYTDQRADTRATLRITAASIGNLNDVDTTGASNGQALVWSSSNSQWEPGTVSGGGGSTGDISFSSSTITSSGTTVTIDDNLTVTGNLEFQGELQFNTNDVPKFASNSNINLEVGGSVTVTKTASGGGGFRLANMTTTERDALAAANGEMIYNTTLNKIQGYQNGAWINLDGT